jgi:tetratricopeptide (TPR) repeat protein
MPNANALSPADRPVWDRFHAGARPTHADGPAAPPLNAYSETLFTLGAQAFLANQAAQAEMLLRMCLGAGGNDFAALGVLALIAIERKDHAAAEGWLCAALVLQPDEPTTLNNLGEALRQQDRYDEAIACYARATTLVPDYAEAYDNWGCALVMRGQPEAALSRHRRAITLKRDLLVARERLGLALVGLNRHGEGLRALRRGLALDPDVAKARLSEAWVLLALGRFAPGWKALEARWVPRADGPPVVDRHGDHPRWRGRGRLAGRTIVLHAEQGNGDTIQFVRYAPLLARQGARVIVEVQQSLVTLLRSLAGVDTIVPMDADLPSFDLHCPLMSLPRACRTTLETIPAEVPYIATPPDRLAAWQQRLGPSPVGKRRIGLAWSGNADHAQNRARSVPLERLAPLLHRTDCEFHVALTPMAPADRAALEALPQVIDHSAALQDFADTAALLSHMDLVLSVDTSVAHLAGALARPTWVLLPFSAEWRWLIGRVDSPWYPTARLFRQARTGDWDSVVRAVMEALNA